MESNAFVESLWPATLTIVAIFAWLAGAPLSRTRNLSILTLTVVAYVGQALIGAAVSADADLRLALRAGWTLLVIVAATALRRWLVRRAAC